MIPHRTREARACRREPMLAALLLLATACGGEAAEPAGGGDTADPGAPGAAGAVIPADDPLLGEWVVIEAAGRLQQGNVGVEYRFTRDGVARTRKYLDPTARPLSARKAGAPAPGPGEAKETRWSWRRVGPSRIELTHPRSPEQVHAVDATVTGEALVLVWREAGSAFTMRRLK